MYGVGGVVLVFGNGFVCCFVGVDDGFGFIFWDVEVDFGLVKR